MHTNSSTTKPPTQYPEFSFSNFIRSSSGSSTSQLTSTLPTSRPSSSSSSSANPSLHLTDTGTRTVSTGHQSNQQSTTAIQPPSHPPTGQANPPMGQPPGGDHQVPIKEGKLFGDLIPPGSTAAQTEPASDSVAKKRKKKKNLHKTKGEREGAGQGEGGSPHSYSSITIELCMYNRKSTGKDGGG